MAKKEKKKKSCLSSFGFVAFIIILICVVIPNSDNEETKSTPKETPEPTPYVSPIEQFTKSLDDCSEYVNKETADELYNFLQNNLGFSEIEFIEKNSVGDIVFDISADDYLLRATLDDENVYSIDCGDYKLYDGENVLIDKNGLLDREIDNKSAYYSIAKEIVESALKAPSTAEFPSIFSDDIKMQRNKDIVAVQSYVDSQNSFGAMIRSEWIVQFKVTDISSYSYQLIYANIDGNIYGEFLEMD